MWAARPGPYTNPFSRAGENRQCPEQQLDLGQASHLCEHPANSSLATMIWPPQHSTELIPAHPSSRQLRPRPQPSCAPRKGRPGLPFHLLSCPLRDGRTTKTLPRQPPNLAASPKKSALFSDAPERISRPGMGQAHVPLSVPAGSGGAGTSRRAAAPCVCTCPACPARRGTSPSLISPYLLMSLPGGAGLSPQRREQLPAAGRTERSLLRPAALPAQVFFPLALAFLGTLSQGGQQPDFLLFQRSSTLGWQGRCNGSRRA